MAMHKFSLHEDLTSKNVKILALLGEKDIFQKIKNFQE